jgi:hypothetical protein
VAGIVKMIQNCALGFIVVGCSVFWSSRGYDAKSQKPGLKYGAQALSLKCLNISVVDCIALH